MLHINRQFKFLSLLLVLSILLCPIIDAAELSLFEKLKLKTQEKKEQLQQRDWWITKAVAKGVGFVAGKAGGAIGAAIGYVIGAGVGGPVAAGMGGMLGFRIGDIVTKTFAKAVSEVVTQWKLRDEREVNVKTVLEAVRSVNKASLTAESAGAVVGDLIGGTMGAAAGIALLAGTGPLALPILGTISAAYIGSKLGKAAFGGMFRWIGRKVFKKGYEVFAASEPKPGENDSGKEAEISPDGQTNNSQGNSAIEAKGKTGLTTGELSAQQAYEKAYREYTRAVSASDTSAEERQQKLQAYREAFERYRASFSAESAR
jgi:hypothetical protein